MGRGAKAERTQEVGKLELLLLGAHAEQVKTIPER